MDLDVYYTNQATVKHKFWTNKRKKTILSNPVYGLNTLEDTGWKHMVERFEQMVFFGEYRFKQMFDEGRFKQMFLVYYMTYRYSIYSNCI